MNTQKTSDIKKIFIASDHAGLPLKKHLIQKHSHYPWEDLGVHNEQKSDYPQTAQLLCKQLIATSVKDDESYRGVLVCASGQGMAMVANRFKGVRAALVWSKKSALLAREHNKANVLCLGARLLPFEVADKMLSIFINTPFAKDRHIKRVEMIDQVLSQ